MLSIFTSTMVFSIDHQSTSNDRLKPVMTTGLVNMHIDRSIAHLARKLLVKETTVIEDASLRCKVEVPGVEVTAVYQLSM